MNAYRRLLLELVPPAVKGYLAARTAVARFILDKTPLGPAIVEELQTRTLHDEIHRRFHPSKPSPWARS